jgi:hypothetical protein
VNDKEREYMEVTTLAIEKLKEVMQEQGETDSSLQ